MVDEIRPLGDLNGEMTGEEEKTLYLRLPAREDPRLRKVRLAPLFFPRREPGGALF